MRIIYVQNKSPNTEILRIIISMSRTPDGVGCGLPEVFVLE